jgi:hypothetical protein
MQGLRRALLCEPPTVNGTQGRCAAILLTRGEEPIMYNHSTVLVTAGNLCLIITLVLAWCLACVRTSAFMKRLFPNYQSLLNAHMDYLLMTGLLMIFYLLFAAFHVSAPPVILAAMCLGSLGNPVGVLVLAVKPGLRQHPTSPFGAAMTVSFALTTVG